MVAPRQQLATVLILSAIDVLLCSFTASLTLFFIGAGADAANSAPSTQSGETELGVARGEGAPGAIIVANYIGGSSRLRPTQISGLETMPTANWENADSVAWLLEETPIEQAPFTLVGDGSAGQMAVMISVSGSDRTLQFGVTCPNTVSLRMSVTEKDMHIDGAPCVVNRWR